MSSRDPTTPERALPGKGPSAIDTSPSTRRSELSQEDYSISQSAESATSSHTSDASFASGYSSKKRTEAPGNELDTQGSRSFTKVTAEFGDSVADREIKEIPKKESTREPDVIRQIDKCIQGFREGNLEVASWPEFRISHDDYKQWLELHEDDWFVKDKLRFDYLYPDHLLVLRMPPGSRHELLVQEIGTEILSQLKNITNSNSASSEYTREVRPEGSAEIDLENGSSRQPDLSYWYADQDYPGVVVEIADSQSTGSLESKAWEYISQSNNSVNAVVGLAVNRDDQRAWMKVWRRSMISTSEGGETPSMYVHNKITFPQGHTQPSGEEDGIRLPLADFVSNDTCDGEIHIPWAELSSLLDKADDAAAKRKARKRKRKEREKAEQERKEREEGEQKKAQAEAMKGEFTAASQSNHWMKLNDQSLTPEEKLDSDKEAEFAAVEKKCDEKAEKDAGDTYCESGFDGYRPAKRSRIGK